MKKCLIGLALLLLVFGVESALASNSYCYISESADGAFMTNIEIDDMGNIAVFDIPDYEKNSAIDLVVEKGFSELIGKNISQAKLEIIPEAEDTCNTINELLGMISDKLPWASSMLNSSGEICSACHSTNGEYTCPAFSRHSNATNFCPECLSYSFGWQPKCSKCSGSGTQYVMGTKMPCSNCLGEGESFLEKRYDICETCKTPVVCGECFDITSFMCPYCKSDSYEEFKYNKVMRDPEPNVNKHYLVKGRIAETKETACVTDIKLQIAVNDTTTITCSVKYNPIKDFKLLIGDDVLLYTQLMNVDTKNSLPEFFAIRAELAE